MSYVGPEAMAEAVRAYVLANQAAKLAAVEARYSDPVLDMASFAAIRISEPDREHEADFPVLFIMPDSSSLEYTAGHGAIIGKHRFEIAVLVWAGTADGDSQAETVKRLSMRYLIAVLEMLNEMHNHASSTYHVGGAPLHWGSDGEDIQLNYAPVYINRASDEWMGDARMIIGLEHGETL